MIQFWCVFYIIEKKCQEGLFITKASQPVLTNKNTREKYLLAMVLVSFFNVNQENYASHCILLLSFDVDK